MTEKEAVLKGIGQRMVRNPHAPECPHTRFDWAAAVLDLNVLGRVWRSFSLEQLAELEEFYGQSVAHFPRAVLWHDPREIKTFADLLGQRVRRDNFCECN